MRAICASVEIKRRASLDVLAAGAGPVPVGHGRGAFAGHQFWHLHDRDHDHHDAALARRLGGDPVREVYRRLDGVVADHLAALGPQDTAYVTLAHGMTAHHDGTHLLDEVLARLDWALDVPDGLGAATRASAQALRCVPRPLRGAALRGAAAVLRQRAGSAQPGPLPPREQRRWFQAPNNTVVGAVRLNLPGREPLGRVRPADRRAVLRWLAARLGELVNLETGGAVVRRCVEADTVFRRHDGDAFADLYVEWERCAAIERVWSPSVGTVASPTSTGVRATTCARGSPSRRGRASGRVAGGARSRSPTSARRTPPPPARCSTTWTAGRSRRSSRAARPCPRRRRARRRGRALARWPRAGPAAPRRPRRPPAWARRDDPALHAAVAALERDVRGTAQRAAVAEGGAEHAIARAAAVEAAAAQAAGQVAAHAAGQLAAHAAAADQRVAAIEARVTVAETLEARLAQALAREHEAAADRDALADRVRTLKRLRDVAAMTAWLQQADVPETLLVSVVMPTRDRRALLASAIDSVLAQSYARWELLVVDDGSKDGTAAFLATFDDPRIRVVRGVGAGACAARNRALAAARGDVVAYLDDDNRFDASWLKAVVATLARPPRRPAAATARGSSTTRGGCCGAHRRRACGSTSRPGTRSRNPGRTTSST